MSYTIEVQGYKEVLGMLSSSPDLSYLLPDMDSYMLQLNYKLSEEVDRNYFVPYELDSLYLGAKVSYQGGVLSGGLEYKDKRVPLAEYPHTTAIINFNYPAEPGNAIPYARTNKKGEAKVSYIPVNRAQSVRVKIRRSGGLSTSRLRTKFPKFLVQSSTASFIAARTTRDTWSELPTLGADGRIEGGTRHAIVNLFGPSVAELGQNVFSNNDKFDAAISKIMDKMVAKMAGFYARK